MSRNRLQKAREEIFAPRANDVRLVAISKLRPNKNNLRTHPKRKIDQLASAVLQFGIVTAVVVDSDYNVLSGHARLEALAKLGRTHAPVIVADHLTPAAKRAFALAENKIAQNSGWDREGLAFELGELPDILAKEGISLDVTGFVTGELDTLATDFQIGKGEKADDLPLPPNVPVTHKFDLWEVGKHRIICGDARHAAVYGTLLRGSRAEMIFTDPPYNVRISGHVGGRGRTKHREFGMASGELSAPEFKEFLIQTLGLCAKHSIDGSIHYVFMDWRHLPEILAAGKEVYDELKNICVWNKTNAGQGSFYRSQHELVLVFKNGTAPHINTFELGQHGRTRTNVWTYAGVNAFRAGRMDDLALHPTVKPTALVADAMKDCSKRGSIVLDPFLGSGTTLIAAEQVGRRAYGIEIDPAYVDVAIERWQQMTKRDAVLAGTSLTFDELKANPALRGKAPSRKRTSNRGGRS